MRGRGEKAGLSANARAIGLPQNLALFPLLAVGNLKAKITLLAP